MSRIKDIMTSLFNEDKKYTKASLKKDILANKIEGYKSLKRDSATFMPIQLTDDNTSSEKDGVFYIGRIFMSSGRVDFNSDASGETFAFHAGNDWLTLRIKK